MQLLTLVKSLLNKTSFDKLEDQGKSIRCSNESANWWDWEVEETSRNYWHPPSSIVKLAPWVRLLCFLVFCLCPPSWLCWFVSTELCYSSGFYFKTSFICKHGDIMCIGLWAPTDNLLVVVLCSLIIMYHVWYKTFIYINGMEILPVTSITELISM
jgi:hypothetical protein